MFKVLLLVLLCYVKLTGHHIINTDSFTVCAHLLGHWSLIQGPVTAVMSIVRGEAGI